MNKRSITAGLATLFVILPVAVQPVAAQEFPNKPITMVVGFAAGGAADTAARIIARKLGENLGRAIIVDNRAGAGGNIAHQQVANATQIGRASCRERVYSSV